MTENGTPTAGFRNTFAVCYTVATIRQTDDGGYRWALAPRGRPDDLIATATRHFETKAGVRDDLARLRAYLGNFAVEDATTTHD